MFDAVIKNGTIIDGTGSQAYLGDIAVKGDRIEAVEKDLGAASAACAIDASGMLVCPGFIDIHTHSDFSALVNRKAESALFQGITTDVCGNCGLSMYPVSPDYKEQLLSYTAGLGYKAPSPFRGPISTGTRRRSKKTASA